MFLSKSPVFCPAAKKLKSFPSYQPKSLFSANDMKQNNPNSIRLWMKKTALSNGHASLGVDHSVKGIGITSFFEEKNIFITGATGVVGKVLVEKILRSTPVGKMYVLVRADDQNAAIDRLARELTNTDLFESLREEHGKCYHSFVKEKLIPVVGNICEPNLGMDPDTSKAIKEVVNVIVMSAAITTLNERAKYYGWYNTYHLTKAMAEMVIHETREDLPVLIIRPSSIESCYKEPVPGWIEGYKVFDPVIISYGKGQLPAFLGNPDTLMDIIPLDMVVNATIAAIAKHGCRHKPELNVYHMASGLVNPLRFSEFFEHIHEYFDSEPLIESQSFQRINFYDDIARIKFFDNFSDFSKHTREEIYRRQVMKDYVGIDAKEIQNQKLQRQCKAKVTYAEQLCKMYEFAGFFKARFHIGNTQKLLSEMSKEEKNVFAIDVTSIEWRKYFQEVHIPGLRNHVLKSKSTLQ